MTIRLSISHFILRTVLGLVALSALNADALAQSRLYLWGSPSVQLNVELGAQTQTSESTDDSTYLIWSRPSTRSKVTVSTFSPGQRFDLFVEAQGVSNGSASGPVQLVDGMMDTDLIVNIRSRRWGSARLRYTASASVEQGSTSTDFSDVHTVTYTITDQ